eukprot:1161512-Pelagomonas_calceolata.AAC.25
MALLCMATNPPASRHVSSIQVRDFRCLFRFQTCKLSRLSRCVEPAQRAFGAAQLARFRGQLPRQDALAAEQGCTLIWASWMRFLLVLL